MLRQGGTGDNDSEVRWGVGNGQLATRYWLTSSNVPGSLKASAVRKNTVMIDRLSMEMLCIVPT